MTKLFQVYNPVTKKQGLVSEDKLDRAVSEGGYQTMGLYQEQSQVPNQEQNNTQAHNIQPKTRQYKVYNPVTKKQGLVSEDKLDRAITEGGYQNMGVYEQSDNHYNIQTNKSPSALDYAQSFAGGVAGGIGRLGDIAVAGGAKLASQYAPPEFKEPLNSIASDYWKNPKLEETLSKPFETDFEDNKGIQIAKTAGKWAPDIAIWGPLGEAVMPVLKTGASALGQGVKLLTRNGKYAEAGWAQKLNNFLNKVPITESTSSSITLKGAGELAVVGGISEAVKSDDPNISSFEHIVRGVAIPIFAGSVINSTLNKASNAVANVFMNPKKTLEKLSPEVSEYIKTYKAPGKVNEDVVRAADKLDLPLPPSMAIDSFDLKNLEGATLRSRLVDDAYAEMMEYIPTGVIDKVNKDILDNISKKVIATDAKSSAEVISETGTSILRKNMSDWRAKSTKLYDELAEITPDIILPAEKFIGLSKKFQERTSGGINSLNSEQDRLLKTLNQISNKAESKVIVNPNNIGITEQKLPSLSKDAYLQLQQAGVIDVVKTEGISLKDLVTIKSQLNTAAEPAKSFGKLYRPLAHEIDKDIEMSIKNGLVDQKWVNSWREATKYNKENVQEVLNISLMRNILNSEDTLDVVNYMMKNRANVRDIESTLLKSSLKGKAKEKSEALLTQLKRTTFENLLYSKNIVREEGQLNVANFKKLMEGENKSHMVSLLGTKNYNYFNEYILPYMNAYQKKILKKVNTSSTSYETDDKRLLAKSAEKILPLNITSLIKTIINPKKSAKVAYERSADITAAKEEIERIRQLSLLAFDRNVTNKLIEESRKPIIEIKKSNPFKSIKYKNVLPSATTSTSKNIKRQEEN